MISQVSISLVHHKAKFKKSRKSVFKPIQPQQISFLGKKFHVFDAITIQI
jgi:hypothetical protein